MDKTFLLQGEHRARVLGNRGPVEFDGKGRLADHILDAYWEHGFYVFEAAIEPGEMQQLTAEFEELLDHIPVNSDVAVDRQGRAAVGLDYALPSFRFARPLSDPHGETDIGNGRYEAKMTEPDAPADAPEEVLLQVNGALHFLKSALRLYGHPQLLSVAEQVNGQDFTPFTDTIWIKPGGLGASVAWHQDGTTQWSNPDLDGGTHGFNFMVNLYRTNAENALWVVPGTHDSGKLDIKAMVADNDGSDQLPNAVPMLCAPGDVAICNRQVLHGSFANTSPDMRATYVFGFHRRASVLNAAGWGDVTYDEARIHDRSKVIALAVSARVQDFPAEQPYQYKPLANEDIQWNASNRDQLLRDYNLKDLGI